MFINRIIGTKRRTQIGMQLLQMRALVFSAKGSGSWVATLQIQHEQQKQRAQATAVHKIMTPMTEPGDSLRVSIGSSSACIGVPGHANGDTASQAIGAAPMRSFTVDMASLLWT